MTTIHTHDWDAGKYLAAEEDALRAHLGMSHGLPPAASASMRELVAEHAELHLTDERPVAYSGRCAAGAYGIPQALTASRSPWFTVPAGEVFGDTPAELEDAALAYAGGLCGGAAVHLGGSGERV